MPLRLSCTVRSVPVVKRQNSKPFIVPHTFGKPAYCQLPRVFGHVLQRSVQLTLPDHDVDHNQGLEYDCPCRITKSQLHCSKDLCDTGLAGMRRNQDVLDIFGFGGRKLFGRGAISTVPQIQETQQTTTSRTHLDFRGPLHGFLKIAGHCCREVGSPRLGRDRENQEVIARCSIRSVREGRGESAIGERGIGRNGYRNVRIKNLSSPAPKLAIMMA